MVPATAAFFSNLNYESYPFLITQAISTITHGSAIMYSGPGPILTDLASLTDSYGTYLHCIISQFRADRNEHILTFLPRNYLPQTVVSPDVPIYRG